MINDALRLTIDQTFGPRKGMSQFKSEVINQFSVPNYENAKNLWDFVTNLNAKPSYQTGSKSPQKKVLLVKKVQASPKAEEPLNEQSDLKDIGDDSTHLKDEAKPATGQ